MFLLVQRRGIVTTMASREDVQKLAGLARVAVADADLDTFAAEFESILAYVGKLDELTIDTQERVVPVVHNVLRDDANPTPAETWTDAIVAQFPQKDGNSLAVKKIISHD